jgi:hypothetical protein
MSLCLSGFPKVHPTSPVSVHLDNEKLVMKKEKDQLLHAPDPYEDMSDAHAHRLQVRIMRILAIREELLFIQPE